MELCSYGHEEVCFEGRSCPACDMRDEKESEIDDLENEIKSLENKLEDS